MLKIIVLFLVLIVATPASAAGTKWTTTDTVLQGITLVLLEVDRRQTIWGSSHYILDTRGTPHKIDETNIILGKHPDKGQINTYFALSAAGHTVVSYLLRKSGWTILGVPAVTAWQSLSIAVEIGAISSNARIGMKVTF